MKLSFVWGLFILCSLSNCAQSVTKQQGCFIEFQAKAYKNKTFYLASHYGKYQTLVDSVIGDANGKLVFKNDEKYVSGIYMLVNSSKEIEIEFLMIDRMIKRNLDKFLIREYLLHFKPNKLVHPIIIVNMKKASAQKIGSQIVCFLI